MAKYIIKREWFGSPEKGSIVEIEKLHPVLKANVELIEETEDNSQPVNPAKPAKPTKQDYNKMTADELKELVTKNGGTYKNKKEAVAFLEAL